MLRRLTLVWCLAGTLTGCQNAPANSEVAKKPAEAAKPAASRVALEPPAPAPPRRRILQVGPPPGQAPAPHQVAPSAAAQTYPQARSRQPARFVPRQAATLPPPPLAPAQPAAAPANYALPQGWTSHSTLGPPSQGNAGFLMVQQQMAEERRRIQAQNAAIIQQSMNYNRPQCPPAGANYPQAYYPQAGFPRTGFASQSNPRKEAERRYLEARADFLNTKYLPSGSPPRWSADSVRGDVGTGMPLPPEMMNRDATFNPVLQKAQHAEVLRQEMMRLPSHP